MPSSIKTPEKKSHSRARTLNKIKICEKAATFLREASADFYQKYMEDTAGEEFYCADY